MSDDPDSTSSIPSDPVLRPDPHGQPTGEYAARQDPDDHTTPWAGGPPGAAPAGIPGYELLGELGRGGMGVVLKARQVSVGRVVALKVIASGADARPVELARFQVEAEAVAALQHPHVVQLFEYGHAGGHRFLALEYVPGGTLAARLRGRPFPPRAAAEVMVRLAAAVHAAHAKGVLHRDLKPGNVLMTEAGEPKVTDFGLARVGVSDLTADGLVIGTPNYMSPEQAAGDTRAVGTRSDVWALGAILYELLTGQPPFRRDTVGAVIHAVIHDPPAPPRRLNRRVPRDLETICLKCLQKDPADRYPSADALATDLAAYLGGYPVAARPVGVVRRTWKWVRRHPVRAGLLTTLFAAGLAAGLLVPRVQPLHAVAEGSARTGVWVERDRAAEDLLGDVFDKVRVFRYTGRPVDFWIELEVEAKQMFGGRLRGTEHIWRRADLDELGPDQHVEGLFIWGRGDRHADGTETWRVIEKRVKSATGRSGRALVNAVGHVRAEQANTSQRTSRGSTTLRQIPLWPAWDGSARRSGETKDGPPPSVKLEDFKFSPLNGGSDTAESELEVITNPIPTDRPICVLEMKGGIVQRGGQAKTLDRVRARVMCQVVDDTPKE